MNDQFSGSAIDHRRRDIPNAVVKPCVLLMLSLFAGGCGGESSRTEVEQPEVEQPEVEQPEVEQPEVEQSPVETVDSNATSSPEPSDSVATNVLDSRTDSQAASPEMTPRETLPSDPFELIDRAIESLESGESESAFEIARKAKRIAPDDPDVLFTYARTLAARSRFFEAVRILDRLAEAHPETRLFAIGQTAEWLVEMGDAEAAEQRYRDLRREVDDASQSFVDHQLVLMFLRQGERFKAADVIRELCKTGDVNLSELILLLKVGAPLPGSEKLFGEFEPVTNLGVAMQAISREDWQKVMQTLERQDATDRVIAFRGRAYAEQNQADKLGNWISNEHASVSGLTDAKFAFAVQQLADQQEGPAANALCNVLLRDPTDAAAYEKLAEALVKLGQPDVAAKAENRARLIRQTQQVGANFASGSADAASFQTLVDVLAELRRPLESMAWESVAIRFRESSGQLSESQAEAAYADLARRRSEAVEANAFEIEPSFILLGLDPDQFGE